MTLISKVGSFVTGTARMAFLGGNRYYYAWLAVLGLCIVQAGFAFAHQFQYGLISTSMRDSVSWGFYIGNFTLCRRTYTTGSPSRKLRSSASCLPSRRS